MLVWPVDSAGKYNIRNFIEGGVENSSGPHLLKRKEPSHYLGLCIEGTNCMEGALKGFCNASLISVFK